MDVLSDICRSIRLEGSIFYRANLTAPWGIVMPAAHEPRFHIVLEGALWFQTEKMQHAKQMVAGDVLIIPEGEWHWIADDIGREHVPSSEVGAAVSAGNPMFQGDTLSTRLICGLFKFDQTLPHPLLNSLPPVIQLNGNDTIDNDFLMHTARWLFSEFNQQTPGSNILLDRLCEVFFIQTLRHIQGIEKYSPGFLQALKDPRINKALQCIHAHPDKAWTLESLASEVAMSRAVFAERFNQLVGSPPKTYLTNWRMRCALNYLKDSSLPASSIAANVGYLSDVTFNRAFQRHFHLTPLEYRKSVNTGHSDEIKALK